MFCCLCFSLFWSFCRHVQLHDSIPHCSPSRGHWNMWHVWIWHFNGNGVFQWISLIWLQKFCWCDSGSIVYSFHLQDPGSSSTIPWFQCAEHQEGSLQVHLYHILSHRMLQHAHVSIVIRCKTSMNSLTKSEIEFYGWFICLFLI